MRIQTPVVLLSSPVVALVLLAAGGAAIGLDEPPAPAPGGETGSATQFDFVELMTRVATGWSKNDTELALSAFTHDALYTEPPSRQMYKGHVELRKFFDAVRPQSSMIWHNLWYDEKTGFGAGEYTFHNGGRETAAHGVAVVEIHDGKIRVWREYQQRGPIRFEEFHDPSDKQWEWTGDSF